LTANYAPSAHLGSDSALATEARSARARLAPNQVGKHGQLQEWRAEWDEIEPHHRHLSPLWGLYPGREITPDSSPVIAKAAEVTLTGGRLVSRHLSDEQYRALQLALVLRPEQGPLVPGGGGIRKLRWAAAGRGKRGGLRVIYYWAAAEDVCYMLYAYAKNGQGDLTREQVRVLARLVREEFK